jgi:hypothetical protein
MNQLDLGARREGQSRHEPPGLMGRTCRAVGAREKKLTKTEPCCTPERTFRQPPGTPETIARQPRVSSESGPSSGFGISPYQSHTGGCRDSTSAYSRKSASIKGRRALRDTPLQSDRCLARQARAQALPSSPGRAVPGSGSDTDRAARSPAGCFRGRRLRQCRTRGSCRAAR